MSLGGDKRVSRVSDVDRLKLLSTELALLVSASSVDSIPEEDFVSWLCVEWLWNMCPGMSRILCVNMCCFILPCNKLQLRELKLTEVDGNSLGRERWYVILNYVYMGEISTQIKLKEEGYKVAISNGNDVLLSISLWNSETSS